MRAVSVDGITFEPFRAATLTLSVSKGITERLLGAHCKEDELLAIVYWDDGTKTVVKCDDRDTYSKEAGLALCYMKKMLGSSRAFNDALKGWYYDD